MRSTAIVATSFLVMFLFSAVPGCAPAPSTVRESTQVILPGEQTLNLPEGAASSASSTAAASTAAVAPAAAGNAPASTAAPSTTTTGSGTGPANFVGRVFVQGTPHALPPIKQKGDATVKDAVCIANAIPDESVVVGAGGGLADVFVYAKKFPAGVQVPPPPTDPAVLDQNGCRFVPQAMVFRAGQPFVMKNSDPVVHNIRTAAFNKSLNSILQPNDKTGITESYSRPERIPVQTRCDIHAWMLGYHLPADSPWATVTKEDGTFEIPDLPPGEWEFVVWHGKALYVERTLKLSVGPGQEVRKEFPVEAAKLSR